MTYLNVHRAVLRVDDLLPDDGPYLYDLNTQSPISVTDQMRRGFHLIQEALQEKVIGPDKPLLVIGAGVAGMIAAMTAVERGVTTRVIERAGIFSVQANCPSRFVCPTQYGWPAEGWQNGVYPFEGEPMPFYWFRGRAAIVAEDIRRYIESFLVEKRPMLKVINSEFRGYDLTLDKNGTWRVIPFLSNAPKDAEFPSSFAMVVACAGFGEEETRVKEFIRSYTAASPTELDEGGAERPKHHPYTGHIFWERDQYELDDPPLGIRSGGAPNVMISGSGDGALQDFLRIVTRSDLTSGSEETIAGMASSAGAIYHLVAQRLPSRTRGLIEEEIRKAEDRYKEELFSGAGRSPDPDVRKLNKCCAHAYAHLGHLNLIKEICQDSRAWHRVVNILDDVVKDLRTELSIKLVYPCFHISPFYGLNRFMVLLITAYAYQRYPDVQLLYPGSMVTDVIGADEHAPPADTCKNAEYCHGKAHDVFYTTANCLTLDRAHIVEENELSGGPYNIVVIRHGIKRDSRKNLLMRHETFPNL